MAASSSSSSSVGRWNYDVFISFKADDTRKIFVGHLHKALHEKAINTFLDSDDPSEVMEAIADSRLSIVVFSKHYASSKWCMKELVRIMSA